MLLYSYSIYIFIEFALNAISLSMFQVSLLDFLNLLLTPIVYHDGLEVADLNSVQQMVTCLLYLYIMFTSVHKDVSSAILFDICKEPESIEKCEFSLASHGSIFIRF